MTASDSTSSLRNRFCYLPPQTKKDYGSASAYCEAIAPYQTARDLYKQAQAEYQNTLTRQRTAQPQAQSAQPGVAVQNIHIQINRVNGGAVIHLPNGNRTISHNYRPAPFLKRVLAELVDFCIFFLVKVIIVWILIDKLGIIDLEEYEKLLGNQADLGTLIDVTQSLFPYELLCKVIVTIFEAICISYPIFPGFPRGATPGKLVMRIRVISANTVIPSNVIPGNVTVIGLERIPFRFALIRSMVKNLFINSLLPLSTIAFAFNQNRALYDIMSGTMVVDGF